MSNSEAPRFCILSQARAIPSPQHCNARRGSPPRVPSRNPFLPHSLTPLGSCGLCPIAFAPRVGCNARLYGILRLTACTCAGELLLQGSRVVSDPVPRVPREVSPPGDRGRWANTPLYALCSVPPPEKAPRVATLVVFFLLFYHEPLSQRPAGFLSVIIPSPRGPLAACCYLTKRRPDSSAICYPPL